MGVVLASSRQFPGNTGSLKSVSGEDAQEGVCLYYLYRVCMAELVAGVTFKMEIITLYYRKFIVDFILFNV